MTETQSTATVSRLNVKPRIISRADHSISRADISDNALKVLYRLKNAGFKSCLVGGCVRDILLGIKPKDFDVVTDARPEQIRELFRNCRLIGRRFRLAHVRFGSEIIEVSTFRAPHHMAEGEGHIEDGRIVRDNVYGGIEDDVWRRDFTVNALFYDIRDFTVVDYVGGLYDIEHRLLRLIGEPHARFREDPVRMLRAVRFAVKLGFRIDESALAAIHDLHHLLDGMPPGRMFEEFIKLFMNGHATETYRLLRQHRLFEHLFPDTSNVLEENEDRGFTDRLLVHVFDNTDNRIRENKPVTPAFILAALLWTPLRNQTEDFISNGVSEHEATLLACDAVISRQVSNISMPRRFSRIAREIWSLQHRFKNRRGKRPLRLLSHPRYRAAYDFLLLRRDAGDDVDELVEWWTAFMRDNEDVVASSKPHKVIRKRPRPRRRKHH